MNIIKKLKKEIKKMSMKEYIAFHDEIIMIKLMQELK